jgi:hypothetical protein
MKAVNLGEKQYFYNHLENAAIQSMRRSPRIQKKYR